MPQPDKTPLELPGNVEELEDLLSHPPAALIESCHDWQGDVIVLGVGGKMGPTLARMAQRAFQSAGSDHRVIGVSRFSSGKVRQRLEDWGIQTIACDLLDESEISKLPQVPNVIAMPGFKFGVQEHPEQAWAANCYLPALICQHFRMSRIVAFSTGNVYGMVPHDSGGSVETDQPRPEGEYAMTALGRERMYEFFSIRDDIPIALLRLNYATELRYGVLVDLAQQLTAGQPVDISMSYVNVIWLADANAMALRALAQTCSPAKIINVAGPDMIATRELCQRLSAALEITPRFVGSHNDQALLNNGEQGFQLLGEPSVSLDQMISWTTQWIAQKGETLNKPTHFQTRSGEF